MKSKYSGKKGEYRVGYKIMPNGCWIWQGCLDGRGYGLVYRDRKNLRAHQFYYKQKYGELPKNKDLHHKCETPACCNPGHLEPLTTQAHTQITQGKIRPFLKEIIKLHKEGKNGVQIGKIFNVCKGTITNFINGKTWTNINTEDGNG